MCPLQIAASRQGPQPPTFGLWALLRLRANLGLLPSCSLWAWGNSGSEHFWKVQKMIRYGPLAKFLGQMNHYWLFDIPSFWVIQGGIVFLLNECLTFLPFDPLTYFLWICSPTKPPSMKPGARARSSWTEQTRLPRERTPERVPTQAPPGKDHDQTNS